MKKYLKADRATVKMIKKMGRPLSPQEHATLRSIKLKTVVDHSPFVTLVRDQGSTPGCCIYTAAAIVDILKERERPYTPNVSAGFIGYAYQVSIGYYPKDPRITIPADGQAGVVKNLGACSEARLSSRNYDPTNPTSSTPTPEEVPSDENIKKEAPLLRIKDFKVLKSFKKEDGLMSIKALLSKGPLGVLYNAHCMALIGYDDNEAQFTFQNSWGEHGPDRGFVRWTYDDMLNRLPNMWVTVINNAPTPLWVYPYTARINLHTPQGRNNLTVRIGVEGQPPSTVWVPAPYGARDDGGDLVMDVPLPGYARNHWPPSDRNRWYLEVTYPDQTGGVVNDVVLVHRAFRPDGTYLPCLYRSSTSNFQIPSSSPEKVFIPARVLDHLILSPNRGTVPAGQSVTFLCRLLKYVLASNTKKLVIPIANQEIHIAVVRSDPIEGTIEESVIGRGTTDANGKYQVVYSPPSTGRYRAIAVKPDRTIIAASNQPVVKVQ